MVPTLCERAGRGRIGGWFGGDGGRGIRSGGGYSRSEGGGVRFGIEEGREIGTGRGFEGGGVGRGEEAGVRPCTS